MSAKAKIGRVSAKAVLLWALTVFITLSCACCGPGAVPNDTSDRSETTPPTPGTDISNYKIIYSYYAKTQVTESSKKLRDALSELTGGGWKGGLGDDVVPGKFKGETVTTDDPEILVGNTNRVESEEAAASLKSGEYVIAFIGNKLVITGADDLSTCYAVTKFISDYSSYTSGSIGLIKSDLNERDVCRESGSLTIMSWNLYCNDATSPTANSDAVDVVLDYLPTVISFQECNKAIHQKVLEKVIKGHPSYKYTTVRHKNSSTYVYTPIIYDSDKLNLCECGAEWLVGRYTGTNTKCLSWAVFSTESGSFFAVIGFHGAVCNSSYPGFENFTQEELAAQKETWNVQNVGQITGIADNLAKKYPGLSVIINGDCNFNSSDKPYSVLTASGYSEAERTADEKVKTSQKTAWPYGEEATEGKSIDHVFGDSGIRFLRYEQVRNAKVTSASDHCPLFVTFTVIGS
ncbi:MAG: hypothetical protein J6V01_04265 [Clostridia bacterium]|nr:hypothetical protein [Clostridia bacterium]